MQRFTRQGNARVLDAYRSWLSFFDEPQRSELLPGASAWALEDYERRWSEGGNGGLLDRLLHLNLTTYLPDDLLVKVDRTSMAHGLEVRSPFLDAELVAFAFQLAPELKLRRLTLKRVLKEAMRELLPAEIVGRRKKGFGVPLDRWFREDLRGYVGARLGARDARVKAHLSAPIVDRLLAEHLAGGKDHGQALWLLLTLEVFLRNQGW
jgi:asparagine synthase (glutamine-hydrolysing)